MLNQSGKNALIDVRKLRRDLKMSQSQFCGAFGINIYTLRKWEAGERHPHGTGRVLLTVISYAPETVRAAMTTGASVLAGARAA